MALTLEVEQKLVDVGLVKLFLDHRAAWLAAAKQSHDYTSKNFPLHAKCRPDDMAKSFLPIIEVNEDLRSFLAANKLTQKYWIKHFTDLIIERVWDELNPQVTP